MMLAGSAIARCDSEGSESPASMRQRFREKRDRFFICVVLPTATPRRIPGDADLGS